MRSLACLLILLAVPAILRADEPSTLTNPVTVVATESLNDPGVGKNVEQMFSSSTELREFLADRNQQRLSERDDSAAAIPVKTITQALAEHKLTPQKIDFTKQKVIVVFAGLRGESGTRITIDKVSRIPDADTIDVYYTYDPYLGGAAPARVSNNPGALAIIEADETEVKFHRTVKQPPKGPDGDILLPPSTPGASQR